MPDRAGLSPAPVSVRRAVSTDLDLLVPLFDAYRRFYAQSPDPEGARAFLAARLARGDSVVFLASLGASPGTAEEIVAGFAQLYPSFSSVSLAPTLILNDLFVTPPARRRGVALRLLNVATAYARGAGAIRLELATQRLNTPALRLYRAHGFVADIAFTHMSLEIG